ncbi:3-hydroxyacyl-CoA dehydrogenase NAD-binding domain-containing protein [Moraxella haemolytica]|nr:3-hydroxyacyl-CoA dehydrogenase NAD-binding domain-containing protein [Moraxella sp. ZY171148]WII94764.1 3-hydroxyacyl-CoA dehydrogenase NAD-binding domain-containing protein [Moraxella sp. ZY171148]
MTIQHLSVIGAGVLGSQIAFQAAYHGVQVSAMTLMTKR